MMNSKEFQLITLKTALLRCDHYGKIVNGAGNELTIDQLKEKLFVNLAVPTEITTPNTDSDIAIDTVQNISNVTIINNEIDCEQKDHTANVTTEPAVPKSVSSDSESKRTLAGKLFQYFKDGRDGSN